MWQGYLRQVSVCDLLPRQRTQSTYSRLSRSIQVAPPSWPACSPEIRGHTHLFPCTQQTPSIGWRPSPGLITTTDRQLNTILSCTIDLRVVSTPLFAIIHQFWFVIKFYVLKLNLTISGWCTYTHSITKFLFWNNSIPMLQLVR